MDDKLEHKNGNDSGGNGDCFDSDQLCTHVTNAFGFIDFNWCFDGAVLIDGLDMVPKNAHSFTAAGASSKRKPDSGGLYNWCRFRLVAMLKLK